MSSYNARVPADKQYQLIMECRSSVLIDFQWCKEHGIHSGAFYNWVSRLRKKACCEIPESISKVEPAPSPAQDVFRFKFQSKGRKAGIHVSSSASVRVSIQNLRNICKDRNIAWRCDNPYCQWCGSCHTGTYPQPCGRHGMPRDFSVADNIYIVCGTTDMRKSIDGLCSIIRDKLSMNPDQSSLFLFCGKRCDRIKVLLHEPDGYVLLYKRLSVTQGRYRWPRKSSEAQAITWRQLDWLLSGL